MMGDNSYSAYTFEGVSANFAQRLVGLYRPHPREDLPTSTRPQLWDGVKPPAEDTVWYAVPRAA